MTSLDFLYIALGVGFIILVIFICAMLLNLTLVLRDVTKITENAREISERVREVVLEPIKALSEFTSSFGFLHEMLDKIRAKFEDGQGDGEMVEPQDEPKKKSEKAPGKGGFSIKKFSK